LLSTNSKTNKERVTEFLHQAVELPTSDCSVFTENESLVQIKVTMTNRDFGPDYKLPQPKLHGSLPSEYINCIENFFTVRYFWATSACPEKVELPWNFSLYWTYLLRLGFLSNFAYALKNRGCREFTVLNIYFLLFRIFEQLALALQNRVALEFFTLLK